MAEPVQIALVEDDAAVLDSLQLYLARQDLETSCFGAAQDLLDAVDGGVVFNCIVSDVRMPGMSGLDLVRHLVARNVVAPIILITGHGDIDMAVSAIKSGAFNFIEKPFDEARLLASIRNALEIARQRALDAAETKELHTRLQTLSERQRQVMELAVAGLSNKEIGSRLNISPKTVENHRAWVMERTGAKNLAELVRIAMHIQARS
jgi:two-component system, LuxR family, response regulator FixJ